MSAQPTPPLRIGIDLGGTKTALVVLSGDGKELFTARQPTPHNDYSATIRTITEMVSKAEARFDTVMSVGVGMPGSVSPKTGLVQNANSVWLNNKPFHTDLATSLKREIRTANDANCLALSEALDGVAQGASSVFGVIIGTGCGGGLVQHGKLVQGHRHIGGEWGHVPLPWITQDERSQDKECWCGQQNCLESWISGPGLAADHQKVTRQDMTAEAIHDSAEAGDRDAITSMRRHSSRLGRGLAMIINIFDPEVIVLGGGLSQMSHLYMDLPRIISPFVFSDDRSVDIKPPKHGDASGVRGAARLWSGEN